MTVLERFAQTIEDLHDAEKARVGEEDARVIGRRLRLARRLEARGRRLIAAGTTPRDVARGTGSLAASYVMEVALGHGVLHGGYGERFPAKDFVWKVAIGEKDWADVHNPSHHVWTNEVGRDHDYGYLFFRVCGQQPWRPWHLAQPALFLLLSANMTLWVSAYPAFGRALLEKRKVLSAATLGPLLTRVAAEWAQNYWREPVKAGKRFPRVLAANFCAKAISNVFVGCLVGLSHQAADNLDFTPDDTEPPEAFVLRQVMATQNWFVSPRYDDLFAAGVANHIEHHLFPDLPLPRLRALEPKVKAACAAAGIPYRRESLPRAVLSTLSAVALYALPVKTTAARERNRRLYQRLVGELRDKRQAEAEEASRRSPEGTHHEVLLARQGTRLRVSSATTLLEAIERAGHTAPSDCRRGACKTCTVTKISGRTSLEKQRLRPTVQLCIARPRSDLVLDL